MSDELVERLARFGQAIGLLLWTSRSEVAAVADHLGGQTMSFETASGRVICYSRAMADLDSDPVLKRYRGALAEIYGNRLDQVVLFGSRARGDATPDSDYDIAVFLKALPDRWRELDRLADLRVRFLDETGAFFDAKPYASASYGEASPLMHEIRHDGLRL